VGAREAFRRSQAHRQTAFRTKSSTPLATIIAAVGKRQAATKLSSAAHTDARTDVTYGSSAHRRKLSNSIK